jgi:uncharacterized protein
MPKRVFIVHGWGGHPNEGWFLWLQKELIDRGFQVIAPAMPETENPKIQEWVSFLSAQVGQVDADTYFVGHSIGCQTIMRYLQGISEEKKSGGAVFVAGWFYLGNLEDETAEQIAKPWLETPLNFDAIKKVLGRLTVVLSDNEPYGFVLENKIKFEESLGAEVIIEHSKGHFTQEDSVFQIPIVVEKIVEISNPQS